MLKTNTVIVCGRDDVLRRAIELFISKTPGWEVITIQDAQVSGEVLQLVEKFRPKVVIIHEGDIRPSAEDETSLPVLLIQKYPGLKVITISLENNELEVFNMQKVRIREIDDLLSAVAE